MEPGPGGPSKPSSRGLRWRAVQEPLICRGEFREDFVQPCTELGTLMATGLEAEIF